MKITSKSILSPGHAVRDPPVSLSTSLSRRLRTNRSLKGGQSPMFPTAAKKRGGAAFDNPEPSSPKVTCIGQVRVKTKKQGKKLRTRRAGEVSFRRIEQNANQSTQPPQQDCLRQRNQKWVHLPITICEALRAFGAEFSCLFPCRSSCFSTGERGKEEKPSGGGGGEQQSSCGAVFARWLVAVEGGKGGREIELVVGGEDERVEMESRERAFRRHGDFVVEEEIGGIKGESFEVKNRVLEEEEEGRVSICVPPKNALLLMRCRSDPNRMSALASRFWESNALKVEQEEDDQQQEEEEEEEEEDEDEEHEHGDATVEEAESRLMVVDKEVEMAEKLVGNETCEEEQENPEAEAEEKENPEAEKLEEISGELVENDEGEEEEEESRETEMDKESQEDELTQLSGCSSEAFLDPENPENEGNLMVQERDQEERRESPHYSSVVSEQADLSDEDEAEYDEATLEEEEEEEEKEEKSTEEKETQARPLEEKQEVTVTQDRSEPGETQKEVSMDQSEEREEGRHAKEERESSSEVLPECLLLMRYEPKLSMEVSKETWVCSTDFVRCLPERQPPAVEKTTGGGGGNEGMKRVSTDCSNAAPPPQPPRSSCSLPATAAASMAAMIEQKLVNAVAYEPFVLTRCKSEPMRTAAAKLAPDTCFWKNRKLEPLRRATLGVGAAGVGF